MFLEESNTFYARIVELSSGTCKTMERNLATERHINLLDTVPFSTDPFTYVSSIHKIVVVVGSSVWMLLVCVDFLIPVSIATHPYSC